MIESIKNSPNEHNAAPRQKSSRANDHCVSTLRWMLMLLFIASAAPASARTENPAVIMLIETAASKIASGTFNQAASVVERALHIEPDNAWIWHLLARIHHLQSDFEMARNMAEKSSILAGSDSALKAQNTWLIAVADQASRRLIDVKLGAMSACTLSPVPACRRPERRSSEYPGPRRLPHQEHASVNPTRERQTTP